MNRLAIRSKLKELLPGPLSKLLAGCRTYFVRIMRWGFILSDLRGTGFNDRINLFCSALAAPVISLRNLGEWQDPVLLGAADVMVRGVGLFSLRAYTDDLFHVLPGQERMVNRLIKEILEGGNVFVDAGANIGYYTVLGSRLVGKNGEVLAVEMMPDTADILRRHIALNGLQNVTIIQKALSSADNEKVSARLPNGKYGQASITPPAASSTWPAECTEVTTITLHTLLADHSRIALVKMDLEGAEELALRGAGPSLRKVRNIIFEEWEGNRGAAEFLQTAGFEVRRIDGRNSLAINLAPD